MDLPPRYESAPLEKPPSYARVIFDQVVTDRHDDANLPALEHFAYLNPITMAVVDANAAPPRYRRKSTPTSATMEPLRPLYRSSTPAGQASTNPNRASTNAGRSSAIPSRSSTNTGQRSLNPSGSPARRWPTVRTSPYISMRPESSDYLRYQNGGMLPYNNPNGNNYFHVAHENLDEPFSARAVREYYHGVSDEQLRTAILEDIKFTKLQESARIKKLEERMFQKKVKFVVFNIVYSIFLVALCFYIYYKMYPDPIPKWLSWVPPAERPGFVTYLRIMYLEHLQNGRDYTVLYEQRYPGFRTVVV
ncbi:Protein of unknown function [Pyronema omphalodes CBS 100304]|uniref:Uncharacterized protein n=1 Tax=Pyronema omphalodes (strain CBS 100304) TaxID=1076935 RepID=U4LEL2_PYROM|nr:Protein of unknown function [Pyronema omphalodes CBS 100304]